MPSGGTPPFTKTFLAQAATTSTSTRANIRDRVAFFMCILRSNSCDLEPLVILKRFRVWYVWALSESENTGRVEPPAYLFELRPVEPALHLFWTLIRGVVLGDLVVHLSPVRSSAVFNETLFEVGKPSVHPAVISEETHAERDRGFVQQIGQKALLASL